MNIFKILSNLYTNKKSTWIKDVDEKDVQPFLIQRWLVMNDAVRVQTRWLDKYVFALQNNPKMYLSLAWSVLPKYPKTPFVKYIKQNKEEEEFKFLFDNIRRQFKLSDNDMHSVKPFLLKAINKNMEKWFAYYGIPKKYWKKYNLNFDKIKKLGTTKKPVVGLAKWGI